MQIYTISYNIKSKKVKKILHDQFTPLYLLIINPLNYLQKPITSPKNKY